MSEVRGTCKNCIWSTPSYKSYFCQLTGKRVSASGCCGKQETKERKR